MERIITYDMLKRLHEFGDGKSLITSFYLSTLEERGDFVARASELLKTKRDELEKEGRFNEHVENDFNKIEEFVRETLIVEVKDPDPFIIKGVTIFSSSPKDFFQAYLLPQSLRERVVVDFTPYIRPLSLLLDEYKRYLTVVLDRKKARFYEMFMGSIVDVEKLVNIDPRSRVKSPPPRKKRAYNYEVATHYILTFETVLDLMRTRRYDLIILGGPKDVVEEVDLYIPYTLREKVAGTFVAEPSDSMDIILERARKVEYEVEKREEEELIRRFERLTGSGQAVSGIKDTLNALIHNQIQVLLVSVGYETPGVRCPACGYLDTEGVTCPICGNKLVTVPDVIDDMIEEAIEQGVSVEHVKFRENLVGGLLRFKD